MAMVSGLLYCKKVIADNVDDTPPEVEIQLQRLQYYKSKIIDEVPDEDDTMLSEDVKCEIKYTIRINDDDPM